MKPELLPGVGEAWGKLRRCSASPPSPPIAQGVWDGCAGCQGLLLKHGRLSLDLCSGSQELPHCTQGASGCGRLWAQAGAFVSQQLLKSCHTAAKKRSVPQRTARSLLATSAENYCMFSSAMRTDKPVPSLSGCSSARTLKRFADRGETDGV